MRRNFFFHTPTRSIATQIEKQSSRLKIVTWPPALKHKNSEGRTIAVDPITSIEAKRMLAVRTTHGRLAGIDIYGHAAAELKVNFLHPEISPELVKFVWEVLNHEGVNIQKLNTLYAYVSWFPKFDDSGSLIVTGRRIADEEKQQFLARVRQDDDALMAVKKRALNFLSAEYKAQNSDPELDIFQYGKPDPTRIFSLTNLDIEALVRSCFQMMKYTMSPNGALNMKEVLPDATYYGLDMLRKHRQFVGYNREENEPISPEHVCTTAVLRLLEAGVGKNKYYALVEKAISENTEFFHGLPIVELTHAIAKQIVLNENLKSIDTPQARP